MESLLGFGVGGFLLVFARIAVVVMCCSRLQRSGGADLRREGRRCRGARNPQRCARNRVAIVASPPLARTLHASVEVDEAIPAQHYAAVAEIIGYVMRLGNAPARPKRP